MRVRWLDSSSPAACPACGDGAVKIDLLEVDHVLPSLGRVRLTRCGACSAGFLVDPPPFEYAVEPRGEFAAHYVEQGAGIDVMVRPLLRLGRTSARFLEIGCGFGFALDFARHALGWEVVGVDPSTLAARGREELGLPILTTYFSDTTELGDDRFDVVLCSEILEHVPDPRALLRAVVGRLAPGGIVVLTTPDLAAVTRDAPPDLLGRALSPGLHLVLYDRPALARLLAACGLGAVRVERPDTTLVAFAARSADDLARVTAEAPGHRDAVRRYLDRRAREFPLDSALASGLAARHLKLCAHAADWPEAAASRDRLAGVLAARFGLDLGAPEAAARRVADILARPGAAPVPYAFGGALYFTGLLELATRPEGERAAAYFAAAAEVTARLLAFERPASIYDSETLALHHESRKHLPMALARRDPEAAANALAALDDAARTDDPLPAELFREAALQTFVRWVNAAAWAVAARHADTVAGFVDEILARDPHRRGALDALYCLGLLDLHAGRTGSAAARCARVAGLTLGASPANADLGWWARLHEGAALARAGALEAARRAYATILAADGAAGVPAAVAAAAAERAASAGRGVA